MFGRYLRLGVRVREAVLDDACGSLSHETESTERLTTFRITTKPYAGRRNRFAFAHQKLKKADMKPGLLFICALLFSWSCQNVNKPAASSKPTVVIVPGAWGGAWGYSRVDSALSAKNATVYRLSLTGLGDRAHLATPDIGLQTHILDVVNLILYEDLRDVILVGHSYGGMVITGAADSIPDRIKQLIYVDGIVPEHGENALMHFGEDGGAENLKAAVNGFLIPAWVPAGKLPPKDTPHPLKTLTDPIRLENRQALTIPRAFVACGWIQMEERAKKKGWLVFPLGNDHNVQWSDPAGLAEVIFKIAVE
jgi:pimeloyl-ACP methyl ester carboxylesterase